MPQEKVSPPDWEEQVKQRQKVLGNLFEQLKPWLVEFGTWIFGGLLAFNLLVIATLLTVGPAHLSVLVSITTFAAALPLNVSGLFLLRLIKDMNDVAIDDVVRQAFHDADIPEIDTYYPASDENESMNKRRTDVGLRYSTTLAVLSTFLTVLGLVTALWYMAWWAAAIFIVMVVVSVVISIFAFSRLMPPDTEAEKELKRRYQEQRKQQAKQKRKAK